MPTPHDERPDQAIVVDWIRCCRATESMPDERSEVEGTLIGYLTDYAAWFASARMNTHSSDVEQVASGAVSRLFMVYIRDRNFHFQSTGEVIRLLARITTNERRMTYRRENRSKRAPYNREGVRFVIESLGDIERRGLQSEEDPVREYEHKELIDACSQRLDDLNHRQVFRLLIIGFTREEMARELGVDRNTIRRWTNQVRRILAPHFSHLAHQPPTTNHQPC